MSRADDDRYLWDRSGPVDPEVRALEELLGRFGCGGRRRRWKGWMLAAAAALVAVTVGLVLSVGSDGTATELRVAVGGTDGPRLGRGDLVETADGTERVLIADVGEVVLEPNTRLRLVEAAPERTRLFLETGRIEAFVSPDAAPRFFQVETPATTCVDLGCRYVLEVDDETGAAHVRVTLGQVAFESGARSVYVPRGAEARARPDGWLGTPRYVDAPVDLRRVLDGYDALEPGHPRRRDFAAKAAAIATMETDTLPLWHMLADPDPEVVRTAERALIRIAGLPAPARAQKSIQSIDPSVWRAHLDPLWWRPR